MRARALPRRVADDGSSLPSSPTPPVYASARALEPVLLLRGPVIKGFGRGSKELGIPTANLDADALSEQLTAAHCTAGIYYGYASVGASAEVHEMVMSIGWCVKERTLHAGGLCPLLRLASPWGVRCAVAVVAEALGRWQRPTRC